VNSLAKLRRRQGHTVTAVVLLGALVALIAVTSPQFYNPDSFASSMAAAAPLVLATMALTPIAIGNKVGIDLSVGPMMSLLNVVLIVHVFPQGLGSPVLTFLLACLGGGLLGLVHGLLVGYGRLQPVIVGLCGYLAYAGLALVVLTQNGGSTPSWTAGLVGRTWLVPHALVLLSAVGGAWWLFSRTTIWRNVTLAGGDDMAAYTSGINVPLCRAISYVVGGILAGVAAVALTAYLGSGDPTVGANYTLTSVAALVLGGASLLGGRGSMLGSAAAAFAVFLVNYIVGTFDFGTISSYVVQLSYGLILIIALVLGVLNNKLRKVAL
jgi:ribose transport system permease protein